MLVIINWPASASDVPRKLYVSKHQALSAFQLIACLGTAMAGDGKRRRARMSEKHIAAKYRGFTV